MILSILLWLLTACMGVAAFANGMASYYAIREREPVSIVVGSISNTALYATGFSVLLYFMLYIFEPLLVLYIELKG